MVGFVKHMLQQVWVRQCAELKFQPT